MKAKGRAPGESLAVASELARKGPALNFCHPELVEGWIPAISFPKML